MTDLDTVVNRLLCRFLGHAQPRYRGQTSDLTAGGQSLRCYRCDAELD